MQQTLPTYLKHILKIDLRALVTMAPELIYNTNQPSTTTLEQIFYVLLTL